MPLNIIKSGGNGKISLLERQLITDPDAINYINLVEQADNQTLELETKIAINNFVKGCKNDGIWDAIKSSCILAGARTLNGALIPLKGTAPTNSNFISSDYNRATGLKGDGSTKYLNSNRNSNSDPQDNFHQSVYVSEYTPSSDREVLIGVTDNIGGTSMMQNHSLANAFLITNRSLSLPVTIDYTTINYPQFLGSSRNSSSNFSYFVNNTTTIANSTSFSQTRPIIIFARNQTNSSNIYQFSRARIGFYSIGENLNLSLLNNRITTLMNSFSTLT